MTPRDCALCLGGVGIPANVLETRVKGVLQPGGARPVVDVHREVDETLANLSVPVVTKGVGRSAEIWMVGGGSGLPS